MGKEPLNRSHLKIVATVVAVLIVLFLMVWVRAFIGSMRAWEQGEALFQEKKYIRAVTFFDRSIHWYTPFNPYVERSAHRLWEIGTKAEKEGDFMLALIAFRAIRRGFHGTEGIYSPGKAWIEKSSTKVKKLSKHEGKKGVRTVEERVPAPPDIFWSLMVEVGLLGWLVTMVILVVRLFRKDRGKKPTASSRVAWGVLSCCFFLVWVIGMIKA